MAAPITSTQITSLKPWSSNPLMRRGDRTLGFAWLLAMAAMIVAIPISMWAGLSTYHSVAHRAASVHSISATVTAIDDSDSTSLDASATVAWGREAAHQTTQISVPRDTHVGTLTHIWVDAAGDPVPNPGGFYEHLLCGMWIALLVLFAVGALAGAGISLTRSRVARRHANDWEREWRQACTADGWASRQL